MQVHIHVYQEICGLAELLSCIDTYTTVSFNKNLINQSRTDCLFNNLTIFMYFIKCWCSSRADNRETVTRSLALSILSQRPAEAINNVELRDIAGISPAQLFKWTNQTVMVKSLILKCSLNTSGYTEARTWHRRLPCPVICFHRRTNITQGRIKYIRAYLCTTSVWLVCGIT